MHSWRIRFLLLLGTRSRLDRVSIGALVCSPKIALGWGIRGRIIQCGGPRIGRRAERSDTISELATLVK